MVSPWGCLLWVWEVRGRSGAEGGEDQPGARCIPQRLWDAGGAQGWGRPTPCRPGYRDPPTVLITSVIPGFQKASPPRRSNYRVPVSVCSGEPAGTVLKLVKPAWVPWWAVMNLIIKVLTAAASHLGPEQGWQVLGG